MQTIHSDSFILDILKKYLPNGIGSLHGTLSQFFKNVSEVQFKTS